MYEPATTGDQPTIPCRYIWKRCDVSILLVITETITVISYQLYIYINIIRQHQWHKSHKKFRETLQPIPQTPKSQKKWVVSNKKTPSDCIKCTKSQGIGGSKATWDTQAFNTGVLVLALLGAGTPSKPIQFERLLNLDLWGEHISNYLYSYISYIHNINQYEYVFPTTSVQIMVSQTICWGEFNFPRETSGTIGPSNGDVEALM